MDTVDEMTDAQKAWILLKELKELQRQLWDTYHDQFGVLEKREVSLSINPDDIPF